MHENTQSLRRGRIAALLNYAAKAHRDARAAIRRSGKRVGAIRAKELWPQKQREWLTLGVVRR
jgi:hypothetical protein